MKRHFLYLLTLVVVAASVSACTITVEPNQPRQPDYSVGVGANPNTPVESITVPAGATRLIRIERGSAGPLFYVELSANMELELANPGRNRLASSSSGAFFGQGSLGLASGDLQGQSIVPGPPCRGSCIIRGPESFSHYFALVRNNSSVSQTVDLFVYADRYIDEYEPSNNQLSTTTAVLDVFGTESGAIETIGDVDYWRVVNSGYVIFDAPSQDIEIVLRILNSSGTLIDGPYFDGTRLFLEHGEIVVVEEATNTLAGIASASAYYFSAD